MKIHKILIGCSLFIAISFITGCSSKSNTTIGDIETTVISDDELNKNAHEISEGLPDNASVYSVPNMSEEIESSMIGEVVAMEGPTITINIHSDTINDEAFASDDTNIDGTNSTDSDNTSDSLSDANIIQKTFTATEDTIVQYQDSLELLTASLSDISVGDKVNLSYILSETGEEILSTITIINITSNTTTPAN